MASFPRALSLVLISDDTQDQKKIMLIGILGAGGIGGYYGGMLALSGHAVHLLAQGENLVMLRKRRLEVRAPEDSFVVQVKAADDVREFGSIDWAIVTVKTYSLTEIAPANSASGDRDQWSHKKLVNGAWETWAHLKKYQSSPCGHLSRFRWGMGGDRLWTL